MLADFEHDSLFQVNVLLWATVPQPQGAPIKPVLRDQGFDLYAIELPLDAPTNQLAVIQSATTNISPNPVPDVVLVHRQRRLFVIIECKPASFGLASDKSKQARRHIVAAGSISLRLAGVTSDMHAEVCYLVPSQDVDSMNATLLELPTQLAKESLPVSPIGSLGISVDGRGTYLTAPQDSRIEAVLPNLIKPEREVFSQGARNARPLYLIPWLPNAPSNDNTAFFEKTRSTLISHLGRIDVAGRPEEEITLEFRDLLSEMTLGIFDYWRDRDSLNGQIFPVLNRFTKRLVRNDGRSTVTATKVVFRVKTAEEQTQLIDAVRTAPRPTNLEIAAQQEVAMQQKFDFPALDGD